MSVSLAALLMGVFATLAFEIFVRCDEGDAAWKVAFRMLQAIAILWVVVETMRP